MRYGLIAGVILAALLAGFRLGGMGVIAIPEWSTREKYDQWSKQAAWHLISTLMLAVWLVYEVSR